MKRSEHGLTAVFFLFFALCILYAYAFEPNWIVDSRFELKAKITAPLRIAHLSDLHTEKLGKREWKVIHALESEKPDVIVISGDTISNKGFIAPVRDLLQRFRAPLGVWLVLGNWEHTVDIEDERGFYRDLGVHLLLNEAKRIREDIWIVGFDDISEGTPNLDVFLNVPADAYKIALFHSPKFYEKISDQVDLAFSGHTHGGQVRFPFLPPLYLPKGCGKFVEGWYEENRSKMYVSRGIGTTVMPIRFLARPELVWVTLRPE